MFTTAVTHSQNELSRIERILYEMITNDPSLLHIKNTKRLLWSYWQREGNVHDNLLRWEDFQTATSAESITRSFRKVKEKYFPNSEINESAEARANRSLAFLKTFHE